jgi:hypothetical protein
MSNLLADILRLSLVEFHKPHPWHINGGQTLKQCSEV